MSIDTDMSPWVRAVIRRVIAERGDSGDIARITALAYRYERFACRFGCHDADGIAAAVAMIG